MKVIPKFDNGGYIIYQPMVQPLKIEPPTNDKSQSQANSSKSNTLEQKDLLDLLKTVDGLPNDMDAIAKNAINLLNSSSLNTSDLSTNYISNIIGKLTIVGSIFLVIIAGLPILFSKFSGLPSSVTIGGTGLLIVVGVAIETYKQIESSLVSREYKRGRRRR